MEPKNPRKILRSNKDLKDILERSAGQLVTIGSDLCRELCKMVVEKYFAGPGSNNLRFCKECYSFFTKSSASSKIHTNWERVNQGMDDKYLFAQWMFDRAKESGEFFNYYFKFPNFNPKRCLKEEDSITLAQYSRIFQSKLERVHARKVRRIKSKARDKIHRMREKINLWKVEFLRKQSENFTLNKKILENQNNTVERLTKEPMKEIKNILN